MFRSVFFFFIAVQLPACQLVFGEYSQDDSVAATGTGGGSSIEPDGTGGNTASRTSCPSNVAFFCNNGVLIDCSTGVTKDCGRANWCKVIDGKGQCFPCDSDGYGCQGNERVKCNATQTAWSVVSVCTDDKPYCDPSINDCVPCIRGQKKCESGSSKRLLTCIKDPVSVTYTTTWNSSSCGLECITDDATSAHCVDCDVSEFVPACSVSSSGSTSTLKTCNAGTVVTVSCDNNCVEASKNSPAHCAD